MSRLAKSLPEVKPVLEVDVLGTAKESLLNVSEARMQLGAGGRIDLRLGLQPQMRS